MSLIVPHIFDEFTSIRENTINLRQATHSKLPFVTISEESGQSLVQINSKDTSVGDYELRIESYDALSSIKPTLKTDIVLISVKEPQTEPQTLKAQSISAVEPSSWVLQLDLEAESRI